jgi:Domain of unknown function (DUF4411)
VSSYWIDSNTLVWAHNVAYPLNSKLGAEFWKLVGAGVEKGSVNMPHMVYKKITEGRDDKDDLAQWLSKREGLNTPSSKEVQAFTKRIGNFLYIYHPGYEMRHILDFSRGADSWLIAHAGAERLCLGKSPGLTRENRKFPMSVSNSE